MTFHQNAVNMCANQLTNSQLDLLRTDRTIATNIYICKPIKSTYSDRCFTHYISTFPNANPDFGLNSLLKGVYTWQSEAE